MLTCNPLKISFTIIHRNRKRYFEYFVAGERLLFTRSGVCHSSLHNNVNYIQDSIDLSRKEGVWGQINFLQNLFRLLLEFTGKEIY